MLVLVSAGVEICRWNTSQRSFAWSIHDGNHYPPSGSHPIAASPQRSNSPHRPRSPRSVNIAMLVGELRTEAARLVNEGEPDGSGCVPPPLLENFGPP